MRESDAWWEHVPVRSKYKSIFPEFADWHLQQLGAAIKKMSKSHPGALGAIPQHGFHVRALRTIDKRDDGRYTHLLAVGICEDVDDTLEEFDLVIVAKANNVLRKGSVVKSPKTFGSRQNAYLPIFEELTALVPEGWQRYMERKTLEPAVEPARAGFAALTDEIAASNDGIKLP